MPEKVLIVDDNVNLVRLMGAQLKAWGYEVLAAFDGVHAIKQAHDHEPDLIILDLKLPAGSGFNVYKNLKNSVNTAIIPIIFMTALTEEEISELDGEIKEIFKDSENYFLNKPFTPDELRETISSIRKIPQKEFFPQENVATEGRDKAAAQFRGEGDAAKTEKPLAPSAVPNKKILVVEDEARLAKNLINILKAAGYEVVWAESGPQGLKMARSENPDLIITDIMLPLMDGYRICQLLKSDKRFHQIPVIMLTGRSSTSDVALGEVVKADAYITKPFDHHRLLNLAEDFLQKKPEEKTKEQFNQNTLWIDGSKIVHPS